MYPGEYTLIGNELSFSPANSRLNCVSASSGTTSSKPKHGESARSEGRHHFIPLLSTPDRWLLQTPFQLGLFERALQRVARHTEHTFSGALLYLRGCIQPLAWTRLRALTLVLPGKWAWVGPRFGANIMLDRSIDLPFTDEELDRLSHLGPTMNQGFGQNACAVNGVGAEQAAAVQADFREMLDVLSVHFAHNRFYSAVVRASQTLR